MNKKKTTGFFAYTPWDALPAIAGVLNAVFVVLFYMAFAYWHAPWWVLICMGFTFSVSIGWNINSVCHNFIHNPFFVSPPAQPRCSASCSRSRSVFRRSPMTPSTPGIIAATATSPDDNGDTIDWVSIYRHSHDHDDAESVWTYTFLSYLRDDPFAIIKELKVKERVGSPSGASSRSSGSWPSTSPCFS